MSIPATAVAAARVALYAAIVTQVAGDSTIHVIYDEPSAGTVMVDDIISVGDVRQAERPWAMVGSGGAGWLVEDITLDVTVSVFRAGDQAAVVFARCCVLVDAVRAAIRNDPSLGGVVSTAYPSGWDFQSAWDEKGIGRFTTAHGTVLCNQPS